VPSADIRSAVVNYFTGTPGLSSVSRDEPWFMNGQMWLQNGIEGTASFVHIDHQTESRVAMGGQGGGKKAVTYDIALVIAYQYRIPADETAGQLDTWVDGLDAVLDAIVARLRADQTLGCGSAGPVWSAGEQDMDIAIQRELPIRDRGKVWSVNYVMFKVTEIVTA
jgi:hypothetical protein